MLITELARPVEEGMNDPHIFKAVFMAGSPGAGKSTVAHMLFSGTGLKVLNVDKFWHLYKAQGKQGNYERYWELYKSQEKNFLDGRLGLIIDGTAKNPQRMAQVKAELEKLGYETAMVFVNTSLETSLDRVVRRAGQAGSKDAGRVVDPEFVKDAWDKTQKGLGSLQAMFSGNFFIVDNNRSPNVKFAEKALGAWLARPPVSPAAKEWLQQQAAMKQQGPANADQ